jgi:Phospholipase_D-nuclease N-terminal
MGRLLPLLVLADLALLVIALIDCLSAEEHEIRALPRVAWAFIILLFSPVGPIAWFVAGRPDPVAEPADGWRPGADFPTEHRPRQTLAPDDDPEFLRRLASRDRANGSPRDRANDSPRDRANDSPRDRAADEARLRAWEADLRRRERELRRRQERPDPPTDPTG